jgi:Xaa-Pro aminopeptidase
MMAAILGPIALLLVAQPMDHAARRAAALAALGARLVIVPSQASFKSDDQAGFQQASDFQYLTGLSDLVGAVLVLDGPGKAATLFLPPPSPLITRPRPPGIGATPARPIDSLGVSLAGRFGSVSEILVAPVDLRGTGRAPPPMAGTVTRWAEYLRTLGWSGPVATAAPLLRSLREIKDPNEVTILARVGAVSGKAMLAGIRGLRPGRTQRMVELEVVGSCIEQGYRHSFWPWTMSGPRAVYTDLFNSFVDYQGHDRAMRAGELVRVDVGCQVDHYMGDVGRTAPVSGEFDAGQREAWDLFIAGYQAGLGAVRDGAAVTAIFETARARIKAMAGGLQTPLGKRAAEVLLSPEGIEAWQFHGVGLDDAEGAPEMLRAGMVVAYELMFAVDDQGFYLEDMLLVDRGGHRMLTAGLPYTAAEIEAVMARR